MAEEVKFEEVLDQRVNSIPFEPFAVSLTSGERFEINNQTQVAIGKSTVTLYYARSGFTTLRKSQLVAIHAR
jgi:hypothetical protein